MLKPYSNRNGAGEGGHTSMLDETHYNLPIFFSFMYLKNLACASKRMLRAVRDRRRWQDNRDTQTLCWVMET